ncbi:MAG: spore coat protein [bacterium]|nr:spore coat protein [bacterium]
MKSNLILLHLLLSLAVLTAGCSTEDSVSPTGGTEVVDDLEIPDWSEATHGNIVDPDYDEVFEENAVKRLDIEIAASDWQDMLDDMTARYGSFGSGGRPRGGDDDNPIWAPSTITYEEIDWYKVGIRFKGNSSLSASWGSGIMKLPFKLDFDEFEDTYPQIEDQRFHGFKQLSLSSGYDDPSLIREKVVADIFREAGLASAHTVFCRLYIDHGEGPVYFGLYTMVEMVDDTVTEDQFAEDGGNLYKPEGTGASFASGTFTAEYFEKKSNEDAADWSDITALFSALHAGTRSTDPEAWRSGLESTLDVDVFLNWLSVNTVIQNWDTYGRMEHNYYLYNDPQTGLLNWIPWDNNEALQEGKQGGAVSFDFDDVDARWPLIRYLHADDVYHAQYVQRVQAAIDGPFSPARIIPIYQAAAALVEPYAIGVDGEQQGYTFLRSAGDFTQGISELISHVDEREAAAEDYIDRQ